MYTVYDSVTGRVKRKIGCPESMISLQILEGEEYIEGEANEFDHKIVDGSIVANSIVEKENLLYENVSNKIPDNLDTNLTDAELNLTISNYFYGRVSVNCWRVDNYATLRQMAYSKAGERADAVTKISSNDPTLKAEGINQLAAINAHDLAVKVRFPKQ